MSNPVDDAIAIWKAGVAAVDPHWCIREYTEWLLSEIGLHFRDATEIRVVGAGKAGAQMALGVEEYLSEYLDKMTGIVNVPEGCLEKPAKILLHAARPVGSNHPTKAGVEGADAMLALLRAAHPEDIAICLISGGGSALLPAPVDGVSLEDKQAMTKLLHHCGATINEMNCVRKHISRIKGGRLAEAFTGKWLFGYIISDVIDDPLDVIASGPTVPDPSTFSNALGVIEKYKLRSRTPVSIITHLEAGWRGLIPDTPKAFKNRVENSICASNHDAVQTARNAASESGYRSQDFGSNTTGEAIAAARQFALIVKALRRPPGLLKRYVNHQFNLGNKPIALVFGGETTVTLGPNPGKGGRNQEFVLAMLCELGEAGMKGVTILSGGTDGEDGPTDAAGAIGTLETLQRAKALGLDPQDFLRRHDAYHFFEATGGLFKTGLTGTNVMDLGVILLV